jgi:hypothetical protein
MSPPLDVASSASNVDRLVEAIQHVRRRQDSSGAELTCFGFDTLRLGIRVGRHGRAVGLLGMIDHRRVDGAANMAVLDVIEGPDAILEALLPPDQGGRERYVTSDRSLYCLWEPYFGGKLTVVDRTTRQGFTWLRSSDALPSWEIARPFLHAFKGLSAVTGLLPVHAAAVAFDGRGILIAGRGGMGKTSLALACAEAGWRYVGDDFVLIGGPPLRAVNLYRSARVREDMFSRLQHTMKAVVALSTDSGELKGEVDIGRLPLSTIGDAFIRAIVVPHRAGGSEVSITPLRRSVALRELTATTLVALPGEAIGTYNEIAHAIDNIPCYSVDPGPRLAAVPAALESLVKAA